MKFTYKLALTAAAALVSASSFALTLNTPAFGPQEVPDNAKRIVVLDFAVADNLMALGANDRVVGISKSTRMPDFIAKEYSKDKYANVGALNAPNFEAIAELNPDLIIVSHRALKYVDKLKQIAPVLKNNYVPEYAYLSLVINAKNHARLVHKEKEVEPLLKDLDYKVKHVAGHAAGKTALVTLANDRKLSGFGKGSRFAIVYQAYGFTPAAPDLKVAGHGAEINFEFLKEKDPDFLFVVDRTAAISDQTDNAARTLDNPLVKETKAYKNNAIKLVDPRVWYLSFAGIQGLNKITNELNSAYHNSKYAAMHDHSHNDAKGHDHDHDHK